MVAYNLYNTNEEQFVYATLSSRPYTFRFYMFRGLLYVDITSRGENLAVGQRVMANQWLIPNYMANHYGNVRFETYAADADEYITPAGFNLKFRLRGYSAKEIAAMEAAAEEGAETN